MTNKRQPWREINIEQHSHEQQNLSRETCWLYTRESKLVKENKAKIDFIDLWSISATGQVTFFNSLINRAGAGTCWYACLIYLTAAFKTWWSCILSLWIILHQNISEMCLRWGIMLNTLEKLTKLSFQVTS